MQSFVLNKKFLNALFRYFLAGTFKTAIAIFEINGIEFVCAESLYKSKKLYIWDQKCRFRVFLGWTLKMLLS